MNLNHRITTAAVGIFILLLGATPLWSQRRMSLPEAIGTARSQSVAALEAKHAFVSTYWAYQVIILLKMFLLSVFRIFH